MDDKTINTILKALSTGLRVEMLMQKDGSIIIQTVQRKKLKV